MARKAKLNTRKPPNVEETLRCILVAVDDELSMMFKAPTLSPSDVKKMESLTSLLLLVRKNVKPKEDDKPSTKSLYDIL